MVILSLTLAHKEGKHLDEKQAKEELTAHFQREDSRAASRMKLLIDSVDCVDGSSTSKSTNSRKRRKSRRRILERKENEPERPRNSPFRKIWRRGSKRNSKIGNERKLISFTEE